ncbi:hypothetical protein B0H14DRAFT_2585564 [Mycena olivaceomarginata]|nr:hypothetical protein B0H14DRAFT_2585564 [Mycena olivaceomarginata]
MTLAGRFCIDSVGVSRPIRQTESAKNRYQRAQASCKEVFEWILWMESEFFISVKTIYRLRQGFAQVTGCLKHRVRAGKNRVVDSSPILMRFLRRRRNTDSGRFCEISDSRPLLDAESAAESARRIHL